MKTVFSICLALVISFVCGTNSSEAADKSSHYVGLHDKLLYFEEVLVVENDMHVSLNEIAQSMYITVERKDDTTYIRKNGYEISYDGVARKTKKDGVESSGTPVVEVEGTLFISVKYIAEATGFKIDYLPRLKTFRIYRDDYSHLSHPEFIQYVQQWFEKKRATKPPVKSGKKSKVNVYLTFDDGPNQFTTINNATLKKYDAQGSFFFLGKHMKDNKKIVKSVADAGHYIGTHSMTHDKDKVYKSSAAFINEMNEGTKLILEMTGEDAKLLRVPYGSKPHVTPAMKKQLNKYDYKMWDWDVDSNDWRYTDKEADQIVKNVRNGVEKAYKSGDRDIIILLHDRSQTTKALPDIIEWLQKEGYAIKTYEPKQHIIQNFLSDSTL
ncbi:polysaccharide deacetylase family protein [Sporosarcina sp. NPDC096371]|uniref:polysaccharide deacetylase family protein n=1 Tax=Sporosarcina sp. NPDC096371 TaxID=3364530 RepID=UPI0037FDC608